MASPASSASSTDNSAIRSLAASCLAVLKSQGADVKIAPPDVPVVVDEELLVTLATYLTPLMEECNVPKNDRRPILARVAEYISLNDELSALADGEVPEDDAIRQSIERDVNDVNNGEARENENPYFVLKQLHQECGDWIYAQVMVKYDLLSKIPEVMKDMESMSARNELTAQMAPFIALKMARADEGNLSYQRKGDETPVEQEVETTDAEMKQWES